MGGFAEGGKMGICLFYSEMGMFDSLVSRPLFVVILFKGDQEIAVAASATGRHGSRQAVMRGCLAPLQTRHWQSLGIACRNASLQS